MPGHRAGGDFSEPVSDKHCDCRQYRQDVGRQFRAGDGEEKKNQDSKTLLTVASGVVPMPSPVPWYITHIPHAAPLANCASLSAMVLEIPLVHGSPLVFAKFSEKEQAPCASWPSSWP